MPDLDLPLLPSPEQIRRREFATIRRGYDPDQVRDFLKAVAEEVASLEAELRSFEIASGSGGTHASPAAAEWPETTQELDPYEALGRRFAGLLGEADKEAKRLVSEAKAESTRLMIQARTEADHVRLNAQARAEEARDESQQMPERARAAAERALTGLSTRRQALLEQLQIMQSRLLSAAEDLAVVIEGPQDAPPAPDEDADIVDPRYEDLWVSTDEDAVNIPNLASIELNFDEERPSAER